MNPIRTSTSIAIGTLALLVAVAANAQGTYSLTGRAATGSGAFVDLPAIGNVVCPSITGMIGFQSKADAMLTFPLLPANFTAGARHNPGGCIPGGPVAVAVNGTGGFTVPVGLFNQPYPGRLTGDDRDERARGSAGLSGSQHSAAPPARDELQVRGPVRGTRHARPRASRPPRTRCSVA